MRSPATSRRRRVDGDDDQGALAIDDTPLVAPLAPATTAQTTAPGFHTRRGTLADHAVIQRLLHVCGARLSMAEFQAQNEEPGYGPQRRLLAISQGQPVGHARLILRDVRFASVVLPMCEVADLVVLPEWQGCGAESALISAAEHEARAGGATFVLARTSATRLFQESGWIVGPRHAYSTIGPRNLLARYRKTPAHNPAWFEASEPEGLTVRLWRRMELAVVMRLYEAICERTVGPTVRSETYWNWLLNRGGCDRLYVAIEGPQRLDSNEAARRIYGYVAVRDSRIVECAVSAERDEALAALLTRVSDDAMERDWHPLRLEAPPDSPLHALLESLGGHRCHHDADDGRANMLRLLDLPAFVAAMGPELIARAQAADLDLPFDLGLLCDRQRWKLNVSTRGVRLESDSLGRSYLSLGYHDLIRMLIGRIGFTELMERRRAHGSTRLAIDGASALFPQLAWWLPTWDSLEATE